MIGALWTGISGLAAQQTALDNESHNIANVNTIGYKSSRISFADQMYQDKIGKGSKILDAEKIFTQGNLKVTGVSYDLALSGSGFFAMAEANAIGSAEVFYTRAGNFRMGDDGNFQDAAGNFVQGWAMRELDPDKDVYSSNKDITYYNADYTKLITSKTIRHSNYIETYSAKATDYNVTSKADSADIYTGLSLKTMANKTADVETLIENYVNKVQDLSENPDGPSSSSAAQVTYVKFKDSISHGMVTNGDNLFVKFGNQSFTTPYVVGNYAKTLQNLADEITSKMPGMNVFVANDGSAFVPNALSAAGDQRTVGAWEEASDLTAVNKGVLKFESMIPGMAFTITSMGETVGGAESNGTIYDVTTVGTAVVKGSGASAVQSAREALAMAVAGKQQDVYDLSEDLGTLGPTAVYAGKNVPKEFTYDVTVYDKVNDRSFTVPQILLGAPNDIHEIIERLNDDADFNDYLIAKYANGNMIIEPLDDSLADIEFAGTLRGDASTNALAGFPAFTAPVLAGNTATWSSATHYPEPDGVTAYELQITMGGATFPASGRLVITEASSMADLATKINLNSEFQGNIVASVDGAGDLVLTGNTPLTVPVFEIVEDKIYPKNSAKSGFKGAGAELLEMVTAIDQTASRGDLQLRLDTLGISDSAFGAFAVDSTGLITMKQDGAEFAIGQLAIAMFNNNRGLDPMGNNLYSKTNESGNAQYNLNNARTATVAGGTLELSEADLSESLVNLMVFQRAFEANAKSITSADELLNTLINLKR